MSATVDGTAGPARPVSVLRSGAVMAAGSVVSRATGFVRSAVVVAATRPAGLPAEGERSLGATAAGGRRSRARRLPRSVSGPQPKRPEM
ncbi:hypothetical protein [Streptomyces sp. NPDC006267]|uniref:hypothetical protein n=1 Tax=Streptomyces sp. NPDC006267 TaxID=3157173 RepID=UPI0033A5ABE7